MLPIKKLALASAFALTVCTVGAEDGKLVRLTSNEWIPYAGPGLPDGGMATKIIREAFAAAGYALSVDFLPWRRALMLGLSGSQGHDGVFAVYAERARSECVSSAAIGTSPVGFAERRSNPVPWTSPADLAGRRIGVMTDYFNSTEFDALVAAGVLKVEAVEREILNLRKVAQGRLDVAVVDAHVFAHLVSNLPDLKGDLQMNARLLEEKPYFVCFRPSGGPRATELRDAFNAALSQLDTTRIQDEYRNR